VTSKTGCLLEGMGPSFLRLVRPGPLRFSCPCGFLFPTFFPCPYSLVHFPPRGDYILNFSGTLLPFPVTTHLFTSSRPRSLPAQRGCSSSCKRWCLPGRWIFHWGPPPFFLTCGNSSTERLRVGQFSPGLKSLIINLRRSSCSHWSHWTP